MSPRTPIIGNKSQNPGPAGYYPKLPPNGTGGYQFGLRTTNDPYITAADNIPCVNK